MAKDGISVHFDQGDYEGFKRAIRKIAETGQKSMWRLLETATIYALQSARKLTPQGKRQRPVRRATKEERKDNEGKKLVMEWYDKDGTVRWIGIDDRDDPRREIKKRGAGKNSWSGLIGKVGKSVAVDRKFANVVNKGTLLVEQKNSDKQFIMALDRLKYIAKLVPDIDSQAMQLAMNRVVGAELKKMGDEADKIWEK